MNRVNDQVGKGRKEFPTLQEKEKKFFDLENVSGCNNGISSIHGKELLWLGETFMEMSVINW